MLSFRGGGESLGLVGGKYCSMYLAGHTARPGGHNKYTLRGVGRQIWQYPGIPQ